MDKHIKHHLLTEEEQKAQFEILAKVLAKGLLHYLY